MKQFNGSSNPWNFCAELRWPRCAVLMFITLLFGGSALADDQDQKSSPLDKIHWTTGPAHVSLGTQAQLDLPAGYRFADTQGTALFMEGTQNPASGNEVGIVIPPAGAITDDSKFWFILFSYDDSGHVNDDEKGSLDQQTITTVLDSLTKATDQQNSLRAQKGWAAVKVMGWEQPPFYDPQSQHLTWGVKTSTSGNEGVNYNSRILGRTGVLSANLIISPAALTEQLPVYRTITGAITFAAGHRYEEFREGDKIAKYGLIGLITGGAAVVAVKAWGSIVKLGAVIVAFFAAGIAKLKAKFKRSAE